MAALGRLGVCRCLQVVRAVHPSFVSSNCLSLRNEVYSLVLCSATEHKVNFNCQ